MHRRATVRAVARAAAAICISAGLLAPAAAQFWSPFGSPRQQQPQRQQQQYNPFGGFFGPQEQKPRPKPAVVDYSNAPPATRRSAESTAAITSPIVVMGDGMADWLAYGLEDAFSEKPEFGIVRKHRAHSGLVRYDPRRDVEWPQIAREHSAAEPPKFIVMMVGYHDRQAIRERSATAAPAKPGAAPTPAPADDEYHDPDSPESRAKASAEQQNLEMQRAAQQKQAQAKEAEQKAAPVSAGPMEFQSEAWRAAYIRRIDATIAAMKTANVPVLWVGLPPQRDQRQAAAAVYLNELYRARAERAGIVYVDIWDGFVDEAGRYVLQGPDFEGQIRRLRSGDGVYFTRAGARKLAHYIEREILRAMQSQSTPVALPAPEPAAVQPQPGKPGAWRPLAGPVIPLTASFGGGNQLLGDGPVRPPAGTDPMAARVLTRGEPINAHVGRADNFAWPPGGSAPIRETDFEAPATPVRTSAPPQPPIAAAGPGAQRPAAQQSPAEAKQPPRRAPRANNNGAPRPPGTIGSFWR